MGCARRGGARPGSRRPRPPPRRATGPPRSTGVRAGPPPNRPCLHPRGPRRTRRHRTRKPRRAARNASTPGRTQNPERSERSTIRCSVSPSSLAPAQCSTRPSGERISSSRLTPGTRPVTICEASDVSHVSRSAPDTEMTARSGRRTRARPASRAHCSPDGSPKCGVAPKEATASSTNSESTEGSDKEAALRVVDAVDDLGEMLHGLPFLSSLGLARARIRRVLYQHDTRTTRGCDLCGFANRATVTAVSKPHDIRRIGSPDASHAVFRCRRRSGR